MAPKILTWLVAAVTFAAVSQRIPASHEHAGFTFSGNVSETFAKRSYFYVGGRYTNATLPGSGKEDQYMVGQIYVEQLIPPTVIFRDPLVFIAGNAQSGTNWLNTPDNRAGWASYFLRQGYIVYLTDQAQRGRSPWLPGNGTLTVFSASAIESRFTAPQDSVPLPYLQAVLHTQWPGTGRRGDPVFDALYASQLQAQADNKLVALYNNASYAALLDRIGPAFVVTHSQAGPLGWKLGDARPGLVRGIIAIEPEGPPFANWQGPPFPPGYVASADRPFGITNIPVRYDPAIGANASLLRTTTVPARAASLSPCERQVEPARRLINLAKVPVLLITGEASYHSVYDYCTVEYLRQASVQVDHVPLESVGIHGNGHFVFLEKNNLEVAEKVVEPWLEEHGREILCATAHF